MFFFFPFTERIFTRTVRATSKKKRRRELFGRETGQAKVSPPSDRTPFFQPIHVRIFVALPRAEDTNLRLFRLVKSRQFHQRFFIHYPIKIIKIGSNFTLTEDSTDAIHLTTLGTGQSGSVATQQKIHQLIMKADHPEGGRSPSATVDPRLPSWIQQSARAIQWPFLTQVLARAPRTMSVQFHSFR